MLATRKAVQPKAKFSGEGSDPATAIKKKFAKTCCQLSHKFVLHNFRKSNQYMISPRLPPTTNDKRHGHLIPVCGFLGLHSNNNVFLGASVTLHLT